ncbi:hypothetical protein TrCOL_g6280, partial [Triparma columacea]
YARIQGKAAMVKRFENSALMEKEDEFKPVVFNRGQAEMFPNAPYSPSSGAMYQTQQHGATTTTTSAATAAAADRGNAQEEYERKLREWQANGGHQQQQQYRQNKGVPLSVPLPVAAHGYYGPQAQGQTQQQQQMAAKGKRLERQTEYKLAWAKAKAVEAGAMYQTQQRGATTTTTTTSAAGGGGNAQGEYAAMAAAALGGNAQGEYERKLRQPTRLPFCLQGKRSSSNPNPFKTDEDRSPI